MKFLCNTSEVVNKFLFKDIVVCPLFYSLFGGSKFPCVTDKRMIASVAAIFGFASIYFEAVADLPGWSTHFPRK